MSFQSRLNMDAIVLTVGLLFGFGLLARAFFIFGTARKLKMGGIGLVVLGLTSAYAFQSQWTTYLQDRASNLFVDSFTNAQRDAWASLPTIVVVLPILAGVIAFVIGLLFDLVAKTYNQIDDKHSSLNKGAKFVTGLYGRRRFNRTVSQQDIPREDTQGPAALHFSDGRSDRSA